jgi:predicted outer membrane protein
MGIRLGKVVAIAALALLVPVVARAQVVTASGGEVALKLTQKNAIDQLIVRDSLELAISELAASRSQNAAVKELATTLTADAKTRLETLQKVAAKADVGRETAMGDKTGANVAAIAAKLQGVPADSAAEFDRTFVEAQIALHEAELASYAAIKPAATDADLKADIESGAAVAQKHLDAAKALNGQLAKPDAAVKKPPTDSTAKPPAKPPVR